MLSRNQKQDIGEVMAIVGLLISGVIGILLAIAVLMAFGYWFIDAYGQGPLFVLVFFAGIVLAVTGTAIERYYE